MVAIADDVASHEELLRLLNETIYHVSITKALEKDHIALLQLSLAHPDRDVRLSALRICRLCLAMELTEEVLSTGIEYILVRYKYCRMCMTNN